MTDFTGMNIAEVRSLAGRLDQEAGQIDQIVSTVTSQLNGTTWKGPDSNRFRGDWTGTHTSMLRKVANDLRQTATLARTNATEQENAAR